MVKKISSVHSRCRIQYRISEPGRRHQTNRQTVYRRIEIIFRFLQSLFINIAEWILLPVSQRRSGYDASEDQPDSGPATAPWTPSRQSDRAPAGRDVSR